MQYLVVMTRPMSNPISRYQALLIENQFKYLFMIVITNAAPILNILHVDWRDGEIVCIKNLNWVRPIYMKQIVTARLL